MKTCPNCKYKKMWKWNRFSWMRWSTPGPMSVVRCSKCGTEFILWLGVFLLSVSFAHKFCIAWHWFLAAVLLLLGALILTFVLF